jgi:hypothetical protein
VTLQTFYRNFRKYASKFRWEIDEYGMIIGHDKENGGTFCPLTAVYMAKTNKFIPSSEAYKTAEFFDLGEKRYWIMNAADAPLAKTINPRIRKVLLQATGLTEPTKLIKR